MFVTPCTAEYAAEFTAEYAAEFTAEYTVQFTGLFTAEYTVQFTDSYAAQYTAEFAAEFTAECTALSTADSTAEFTLWDVTASAACLSLTLILEPTPGGQARNRESIYGPRAADTASYTGPHTAEYTGLTTAERTGWATKGTMGLCVVENTAKSMAQSITAVTSCDVTVSVAFFSVTPVDSAVCFNVASFPFWT